MCIIKLISKITKDYQDSKYYLYRLIANQPFISNILVGGKGNFIIQ
jgi:hypothetical protein